ncbi:predicted protein [Lichtheimia corymbifera JMRC:FSU:9682]|uniref:Uncharacterized protein n=1 Tax=Lichtheimia corymbifera JMRC:FSU:9682 TaxID=1263082 RepID=A0A068RNH5_9FUNG|nr:predicted protein [Lichtheimia corymbifera JMRC:FSU:9682]
MGGYNVGFTMSDGNSVPVQIHEMSNSMHYLEVDHIELETWYDGSLDHTDQFHSFKNCTFHYDAFMNRAVQCSRDNGRRAYCPEVAHLELENWLRVALGYADQPCCNKDTMVHYDNDNYEWERPTMNGGNINPKPAYTEVSLSVNRYGQRKGIQILAKMIEMWLCKGV